MPKTPSSAAGKLVRREMDGPTHRRLVEEFLAKHSFTEKQMGQAMGAFMKAHGGQVEPAAANAGAATPMERVTARLATPAARMPLVDLLKISSIETLVNSGERPPGERLRPHGSQPPGTPYRRRTWTLLALESVPQTSSKHDLGYALVHMGESCRTQERLSHLSQSSH